MVNCMSSGQSINCFGGVMQLHSIFNSTSVAVLLSEMAVCACITSVATFQHLSRACATPHPHAELSNGCSEEESLACFGWDHHWVDEHVDCNRNTGCCRSELGEFSEASDFAIRVGEWAGGWRIREMMMDQGLQSRICGLSMWRMQGEHCSPPSMWTALRRACHLPTTSPLQNRGAVYWNPSCRNLLCTRSWQSTPLEKCSVGHVCRVVRSMSWCTVQQIPLSFVCYRH